jgi:hypothetical protein
VTLERDLHDEYLSMDLEVIGKPSVWITRRSPDGMGRRGCEQL